METAKRRAQTSDNVTRTRTLHRVTAETPENGYATVENVETCKRRVKTGRRRLT
jgi:hypothetical protein